MKENLVRKLIEKGAIRQGTVFEASYKTAGLSCTNNTTVVGEFILLAAKKLADGNIVFEALDDKSIQKRIQIEDITSLDGMDISRVAAIYNLADEGTEVKTAKRRGRKPKTKD